MRRTDTRKAIAAVLVLALHAGLLMVFLQRDRWIWPERSPRAPDIVFVAIAPPSLPRPSPQPNAKPSKRNMRPARTGAPAVAPFVVQPFAAPAVRPPGDLSNLHGQLFRCAPESLANLTPEERAECDHAASAMAHRDPNAIPWPNNKYAPTKNTWRWTRNVQRKNAPPLLPCMNPQGISPIATALCLANAAVNGLDVERKPEYFDRPEQVGVPNGGDPPMTPEH